MRVFLRISQAGRQRPQAFLLMLIFLLAGCRSTAVATGPSIEISRLPPNAAGGPEQMDTISGRVSGAKPGEQIVLYAKNDIWWVQRFKIQPFTPIGSDQTWTSPTHLGTDYAAILVEPGFHPRGGGRDGASLAARSPRSRNLPTAIYGLAPSVAWFDSTASTEAGIAPRGQRFSTRPGKQHRSRSRICQQVPSFRC